MSPFDNLVNQIIVCPRCSGYGFLPPPPDIKKIENCPECNTAGVFLNKKNQIFLFSLPTFVDTKKRRQISLFKKILLAIAIIVTLLILYAASLI